MSVYEKIKIDSDVTEGSFVRGLVGSTGTGFAENTHVHKDWWAKTESYDTVMEKTQTAIDNREDVMVKAGQVVCTVNNDVMQFVTADGRSFTPTDHCLEQFSIRTKVPSSSVMRELRKIEGYDEQDADLMARLGNNALRRIDPDKEFRIRTYTDGTARAFVTDKYAPIDNRWYLETLREFLPEGRFSHWRGDEDTIYGNVLLPDSIMDYGQDDDTDYGGMVSVGNCEIGKRRITQTPSLFRAICMNGCIWGQTKGKDISKVHRGTIDLDSLKVKIAENIEYQLSILPDGIRKFLDTRTQSLNDANVKGVIAAVANDYKLTKKQATETLEQYLAHETHEQNMFGVINAITRAGQVFDNDSWVRLDEVGGMLMDTSVSRWTNVLARAKTYTDKDFDKVYGLTV
jgi:hypothetical protein